MAKGEVSWTRANQEGERCQVYARRADRGWDFYIRLRRFENWERLKRPLKEDWLELLDGLRRRLARRLVRPEDVRAVETRIRQEFPEVDLGSGNA